MNEDIDDNDQIKKTFEELRRRGRIFDNSRLGDNGSSLYNTSILADISAVTSEARYNNNDDNSNGNKGHDSHVGDRRASAGSGYILGSSDIDSDTVAVGKQTKLAKGKGVKHSSYKKSKDSSSSKAGQAIDDDNDDNDNVHSGHRQRMNTRVINDPDFDNFSPHEVLEFLLYRGIPRADTNRLAHILIREFGSFSKVFYASVDELMKYSKQGMTYRAALTVASVIPIARWVSKENMSSKNTRISSTDNAIEYLKPFFENMLVENIYMVCLDSNDYVIDTFHISKGIANTALLDCRQVINRANSNRAVKVILAHNHPAGILSPSYEDIAATSRVSAGLSAIYVMLIDHLIFVPDGGVYSFYQTGVLKDIIKGSDEIIDGDTLSEVYSMVDAMDLIKLGGRTNKKKRSVFLSDVYEKTKHRKVEELDNKS